MRRLGTHSIPRHNARGAGRGCQQDDAGRVGQVQHSLHSLRAGAGRQEAGRAGHQAAC